MRSITELKSLADIRTTISAHLRSTPRLKGSTYLEVYLLDKEKQRLEAELAYMGKRRGRIEARVAEIRKGQDELVAEAKALDVKDDTPGAVKKPILRAAAGPRNVRRVSVEY